MKGRFSCKSALVMSPLQWLWRGSLTRVYIIRYVMKKMTGDSPIRNVLRAQGETGAWGKLPGWSFRRVPPASV